MKTTYRNLPLAEESANRTIRVTLEARDNGSGLRDLRVFRNNLLVHAERGDLVADPRTGGFRLVVPVKLVEGQNEISAYAFNRDHVKSKDAITALSGPQGEWSAKAYIISIGVNDYANPDFNLKHAAADANRFSEELTRVLAHRYEEVVAVRLVNKYATKQNILAALARLAGRVGPLPSGAPAELGRLQGAKPEDNVIVFFSGHGTARGDRYYLIPHDLGYAGRLKDLQAAGRQAILEHGISDRDLERGFEMIDADRIMLVLDACQSGQVLESEERRLGPLNSRGLAQLAYEKGIYVLAAAQSYEAAVEFDQQGSGLLTFVLIGLGLKARAADCDPKDGRITAEEWFDYAVKTVPLEFEQADRIYSQRRGKSIDYSETGISGQFPRAYYRPRETTIRWKKELDPWVLIDDTPRSSPFK